MAFARAATLCCLLQGLATWARELKQFPVVPGPVLLDIAPGTSVGFNGNKQGFPSISARTPTGAIGLSQSGNSTDPGLSFQLGPKDNPVTVSLGRQAGTSEATVRNNIFADSNGDSSAPQGLSGDLELGHYGVKQSTGFQAIQLTKDGGELTLPFAKVDVPPQLLDSAKKAFVNFQSAQPPQPAFAALAPVGPELQAAAPQVGPGARIPSRPEPPSGGPLGRPEGGPLAIVPKLPQLPAGR